MVKVSIIIPVYNVESYINKCLNSILSQTFADFELLLINDGSTDSSLNIIKEYEKIDKRIHVYTQKNKGPALTRNRGINLAKGKYIMFIDSDDYIENDYIATYYEKIDKSKYNIVMGGYKKITGDKVVFIRKLKDGIFSKYIVMGPVCKMYERNFIIKNKIYFLDTNASEDIYFNELLYSKNPSIKVVDNTGYFYSYNPKSISNTLHKGFNQNVDILELASTINYKNIENVKLNEYFIIRYLIWYLLYSGKNVSSKKFMHEYEKLFKWLKNNIPDYKKNPYLKRYPSGEIYRIYLCIKIFIIMDKLHIIKVFSNIYCSK